MSGWLAGWLWVHIRTGLWGCAVVLREGGVMGWVEPVRPQGKARGWGFVASRSLGAVAKVLQHLPEEVSDSTQAPACTYRQPRALAFDQWHQSVKLPASCGRVFSLAA